MTSALRESFQPAGPSGPEVIIRMPSLGELTQIGDIRTPPTGPPFSDPNSRYGAANPAHWARTSNDYVLVAVASTAMSGNGHVEYWPNQGGAMHVPPEADPGPASSPPPSPGRAGTRC